MAGVHLGFVFFMNRASISTCLLLAAASLLLSACGGGGSGGAASDTTPPTATISNPGGTLGVKDSLVVHFSEPIHPASLHLSGELGAEAQVAWSGAPGSHEALTITPQAGVWTAGEARQLLIDAKDLAGNAMPTVRAAYSVQLLLGNFQAAEVVIGQASFDAGLQNQNGNIGANTLAGGYGSMAVAPDGTLFIADSGNNRILAYGRLPTSNNAAADFALGPPDLISDSPSTFSGPTQLSIGHGKFVVTDAANNRVLIYNSVPTSATAVPDVVLGQPDMNATGWGCSPTSMNNPQAAQITEDGKLVVADTDNHRILVWLTVPSSNSQPRAPSLVLGQVDGDHCIASASATDHTMLNPNSVWTDGTRLVVADTGGNRVLIWNSFPTSNVDPAQLVLGQGDFKHGAPNDADQDRIPDAKPSAKTLAGPNAVASNGTQLAVVDSSNARVLVWDSFPTMNGQPADIVLGQDKFSGSTPNDVDQDGAGDGHPSANVLGWAAGVTFYRDKLLVNDYGNSRVLVFGSR